MKYGSPWNNQDSMKSIRPFFVFSFLTWTPKGSPWNHHLSFPKISQLPHPAFTLRATGPEVRTKMGERRKVSAIFVLKNPWKNSIIPIHTCRVCYTYICSGYIYIYAYLCILYSMYHWYTCICGISKIMHLPHCTHVYSLYYMVKSYQSFWRIHILSKNISLSHVQSPRGFGIFESPSGHVSHLRAQFTTKEPCSSTLSQYTRLPLIIKIARPNPFPNMMEVILKCRSSMNLELKLLSMQQIWDFKVPSTELTFSMEHGPNVNAFLIGRMGFPASHI